MRRSFLSATMLAVALTATGGVGDVLAGPSPVQKAHQYRCTDRNKSLYFIVYEINGTLDRGLMYVENMQVANMTVSQAGTDVIKAKVNGDAANVAFNLFKTGKILVANYQTGTRVQVCQSSYHFN